MTEAKAKVENAIEVTANGPYHVTGGVPLYRVRKVPGEKKGTFVDWDVYEEISTDGEYWLCRCGHSTNKPFCTGMHEKVGFDGTETAQADTYAGRAQVLGGKKMTVKDDRAICAHAAFCSSQTSNIWKMATQTDDDQALADEAREMVGRCPSGALTIEIEEQPVEEELLPEIRIQEDASILVRGRIQIKRADGQPLETRNRMALCRCGGSNNKPLCDGTHWDIGFKDG